MTGPISFAVVRAVAKENEVDPAELPPLYETIDADALDSLFENAGSDADGPQSLRVEFSYAGFSVRVSGEGFVLERVDGQSEPASYAMGDDVPADGATERDAAD